MKQQKNLRLRYIQLVETFITALENGRSGTELEDIRAEIRTISSKLGVASFVEGNTQDVSLQRLPEQPGAQHGSDKAIS